MVSALTIRSKCAGKNLMSGKLAARAVYLSSCFKYEFVDSAKKIMVHLELWRWLRSITNNLITVFAPLCTDQWQRQKEKRSSSGLLGVTRSTHFIWPA
jgi:hypothetical protein